MQNLTLCVSIHVYPAEELVPYAHESTDDVDDVLVVLAEELGNLVEYLGGYEYAHMVLFSLQTLAGVEETLVRIQAVASIIKIAQVVSVLDVSKYVLPVVNSLANVDWFTARMSAGALLAVVYPLVSDEEQKALCTIAAQLCADETPMTRRSTYKHLPSLIDVIPSFFC